MDAKSTIALNFAAQALVAVSKYPTPDLKAAVENLQMIWSYLQHTTPRLQKKQFSEMGTGYAEEKPNLKMLQRCISDIIARFIDDANPRILLSLMNETAACLRDHGAF